MLHVRLGGHLEWQPRVGSSGRASFRQRLPRFPAAYRLPRERDGAAGRRGTCQTLLAPLASPCDLLRTVSTFLLYIF